MNIPSPATSTLLARLARPDENMAMRVILRRVSNTGAYTVHGKVRKYVFEFNAKVGAHVLDVPLSLWNAGLMPGIYRDNPSVAHDMQAARSSHLAPLVILPIPFGNGAVPASLVIAPAEDATLKKSLAGFGQLLRKLEAPIEIMEAFDILQMDGTEDAMRAEAIRMISNGIPDDDEPPAQPAPPAVRLPEKAAAEIEAEIIAEKRRKNLEKVKRHREKKRAEKASLAKKTPAKKPPANALV